tara:strand:+ start:396 stop:1277 length:882 start_codon:yes stop_codon:yes gene_type:complete
MKTVNSLSGGKSSSYIAANYPADFNIFALVRTDDKKCLFPDKKIRQMVSDRIGKEFIGTLEDDTIIYTMFDLEQYIGTKIDWLSAETFDEICKRTKRDGTPSVYIPNASMRFCTIDMKIVPISQWVYDNIGEPVRMRIGFRANEHNRAKAIIERCNDDGFEYQKVIVGQSENGRNKWKLIKYREPHFPLIEDNIFKDKVELFWKDKPVRFSWMNNCVGCFHANPLLLKKQSEKHPNKFDWFVNKEKESSEFYKKRKWLGDSKKPTYEEIKNYKSQFDLFDDDFNECDSGFCGL